MLGHVQSTEGNGAALVSIKPCLLMFLRAEARFGNTDHNTLFISYKSTLGSDEKWGLLSCAKQVHYKRGVCFFARLFTMPRVKSFLAVKKIGNPPKHMFHKSPKKWKTRFREEKCGKCSVRRQVQDEFPACPALGTVRQGPAQDLWGSILKPFASYLILGEDLELRWKLLILPAITAAFV